MERLLTGKVALITGGTRGIGKAIAEKFASQGAKLAIIGMDSERGRAAAAEIKEKTGGEIHFYQADVSSLEQVKSVIAEVTKELGSIEILVNNAGITRDNLLMKLSEEEWESVLATNLDSIFHTCHCVIRSMLKASKGKIINITSVVGLMGNAGQTNYAAAKAGMIGFTKALAKEVASRGITVNCIAPGFIQTDMTDKLNEVQKEAILKQIPMKKLGNVEDIAEAALFLSSDLSKYITGQTLTVDGGMVM